MMLQVETIEFLLVIGIRVGFTDKLDKVHRSMRAQLPTSFMVPVIPSSILHWIVRYTVGQRLSITVALPLVSRSGIWGRRHGKSNCSLPCKHEKHGESFTNHSLLPAFSGSASAGKRFDTLSVDSELNQPDREETRPTWRGGRIFAESKGK